MKKIILLTCLLFFIASIQLFGQCGNLYIAGVIDGPLSGGTPKGIQICASGDVSNLSIYGIGSANNGGGSDGQEFTFPAESVTNGDCFWVGSNSTGWDAFFGFTPCYVSGSASINGDDAIELFCSGSVEDLFGDINVDGNGECWEYLDGWAVNNTSSPNSGTFSCSDWTFSGPNALDGETSNSTADTPYPSPAQLCPVVLPVTLISFSAEPRNKMIELSWATVLEINNHYFEIQRSTDGVNFETIGRVNGNRQSTQEINYSFVDANPVSGINYYKLKQVDLDGRYEYSFVVKVETRSNKIKIYPTRIESFVNIEIGESESAKMTIINSEGQTLKSAPLYSAFNSIDISELSSGVYFVRVESGTQFLIERIVKY